ncbi:CAP domain-containing protein [Bacillus canaveralius]|nr:CAP domain-containing protein [Bacillus canaveralius]
MRRFFVFLLCLFLIWTVYDKQLYKAPVIDDIRSNIEKIDFSAAIDTLYDEINQLAGQLNGVAEQPRQNEQPEPINKLEKPNLSAPAKQMFSVYNIEIGDSKEAVEQQIGAPKRSTANEYGTEWNAYHDSYQNFFMLAYDENDKVAGLYTSQDLITSTKDIKLGTPKETVLAQLGEPLSQIRKGLVYFQFQEKRDYDVFLLDNNYVTIFYDIHKNNTVTSMQIISKELEQAKQDFYAAESPQLREGFEYQLFDLTNATRVNHNLPILTWDDQIKETARKHSLDMAENNYFNHTNLEGQSPFDRMEEDAISFTVAGENLASGQFSSIFAHEGLMNSLGHRENILKPEYEFLGVGVAFNPEAHPYYTENFFTD